MNRLEQIPIELIFDDAQFAAGFIINKEKFSPEMAVTYLFGLYGLFSMTVYEGLNYLRKQGLKIVNLSDELNQARHRVKLFEDTSKGIAGISSYFIDKTQPIHEAKMREDLKLVFISKHFQKDMGITYINNLPVYTTFGASFDMGLGDKPEKLFNGKYLFALADELGRQMAVLTGGKISPSAISCFVADETKPATRDVFSKKLSVKIFNGASTPDLNHSLLLIQCRLNFFQTCLAPCREETTLLKYKYIVVYSVLKSLSKLKMEQEAQKLTVPSIARLNTILGLTFVDQILSDNGRNFRNIMVHNDIRGDFKESDILPNERLFGLVEHYFAGMTYDELAEKLDQLGAAIARELNDWSNVPRP